MAFRRSLLLSICAFAGLTSVSVSAQSSRSLVTHKASAANAQVLNPSSGLNFLPAVSYGSGGHGAFAIAVGDVNGDGKPDLVAADWCSVSSCTTGTVGVLLGNGDGTFQPAVSYASGGVFADTVTIADLRGNGKMDIIVGNCGSIQRNICVGTNGGVGVLLGNGDGTFQPAVSFSPAFGVASVTSADVNGDGKLDLLLATNCGSAGSYTGCVGVLTGNGDGTFASAVTYSSGGFSPTGIAVKDVNGDNKLDVVVAHCGLLSDNACGTGNAGVLLGNGDGTFATGVVYDSNGIYPQGVAVDDVNGDGKLDLVVVNSSISLSNLAGSVGVLLGNGDGTFQAAVAYPSGGFGGASVALSDVNGDGKFDIVVANCSTTAGSCTGTSGTEGVGVLLGNGDGTFQTAVTFASGGNTPFGLIVADLNGDSKPDVATANCASSNCGLRNGTVGVLLNASLGVTTTQLASSANPSTFGQSVTFTATVTSAGFKKTPTGTVSFFDGTSNLATSGLDINGAASFTTASLVVGTHSITATYNGDGNFSTSTSAVLSQLVQGAIAQLSTTSLSFGNQTVGIASTAQPVMLTNNGNIPLTVVISIGGTNPGDFAQTNNCGSSVAAGGSCTINVTFTPTAAGARSAAVNIADNAPNSPQSVSLSGVGVTPTVQLSPTSLTFPTVVINTTSKAETVTLTNTGLGILTITNVAVTVPFAQTNTCGASVNPGGTCTFSVTFTPTTIGTLTGSISITDNAVGSPQKITLKGVGTYIQLAPKSVNFGNQAVGTKSATKKITLTNKGSVAVSITSITTTGDFTEVTNCGTSVAAGASCLIGVTFTPSATGVRTGSLTITDNGGGSPQHVGLTGTGI